MYNKWYVIDEKNYKEKLDDLRKLEDVIIIIDKKNNQISKVVLNGKDLINYIIQYRNPNELKDYLKYNLIEFSHNFVKDTCKYRSFNSKYKIIRYTYMQKLLNEKLSSNKTLVSYLYDFIEIKKQKPFQLFLRKEKMKRLIEK